VCTYQACFLVNLIFYSASGTQCGQ
jgi:hypothetical protein